LKKALTETFGPDVAANKKYGYPYAVINALSASSYPLTENAIVNLANLVDEAMQSEGVNRAAKARNIATEQKITEMNGAEKKPLKKAEAKRAEVDDQKQAKEAVAQKIQAAETLTALNALKADAKKLGLENKFNTKIEITVAYHMDRIKESPTHQIDSAELQVLRSRLPQGQKIVQFKLDEKAYTVLVEKDPKKTDQYKFLTKGPQGADWSNHYIMEENGEWVVKERGGISDSTIAKVDSVVEQKKPSVQTANGVVSGNFWADLDVKDENKDGKIDFADIDTNSDGYVDEDEAEAVGIKARLFKTIDSNMVANGLNGDGKLTLAELQKLNEVASEFARLTGRTLSETLLLYKTCELTNISLGELAEAHGDISKTIADRLKGQDLTLENLETILKECGYAGYMVSSIVAQLSGPITIDPTKVASTMMNLVLGSQFDNKTQTELWKINKPLSKGFPVTKDLTANNIEKFITGEELEEDENEESGKKGELTDAEKKTLNKLLDKKGKEAELIKYLKKLKKKYPNNLKIQSWLMETYEENEGYLAEALEEAILAYDEKPNPRQEKILLRIADKYARKMGSEELSDEERELAEKAYQKIKEIIGKKYDDNEILQLKYSTADKFIKALMKYEINDKDLQMLAYIANSLKELKDPPLPGQISFKKIALNEEKEVAVTELKKAYDNFAEKLEAELEAESKKASPDNRKLARIYIKLVQIENLKGNIEKVKKYTLKALGLYANLEADDELRDDIIDSAERIIKQYYGFKTAPSADGRQRSVNMLEIAKEIFGQYKKAQEKAGKEDIEITVEDENQKKTDLKTEQDFEDKKARKTVDADELVTHIFRLAGNTKAVLENGKAELSPESQKQFALMALYLLEKYKNDNTFYKEIANWAKKFAKENKINKEFPPNPLGKFKDYETAKEYIEYLAGVHEKKQG